MKPYSRASSAVNQRSRSESFSICSTLWPVCSAISEDMVRLMCSDCSAWIRMSEAVPPRPPDGWCIMMRLCGSAKRLPLAPADSRNWPIDAARPMATVATSLEIHCMVS